jgi:hypothetical protein
VSAVPLLLVSKSVRALLGQFCQGPLGQLFTPRMLTGLDITEGCQLPWAGVISGQARCQFSDQQHCVVDDVHDVV